MAGRVANYSTQLLAGIRSRYTTVLSQWQASLYVALLSSNPTDNTLAGSPAEAPYTGYTAATSRQAIASSTGGWNAPAGTNAVTMTNAATLTFPTATGSGSITGVTLCCDNTTAIGTQATFSTTGVITAGTLYWNSITTQTVNNGNPVTINAGALTLSED